MLQKYFFIVLIIFISYFSPPNLLFVEAENNTNQGIDNNNMVNDLFKEKVQTDKNEDNQVNEDNTEIGEANIDEDVAEPPTFENQFSFFDFVKMIFALAIVIVLIYIVLRFVNQRNRSFGQTRMMDNLGGLSLGTNRSIQLVKIGDRLFVVGVGENIQLLTEIDDEEEREQLLQLREGQFINAPEGLLNKLLSRDKNTSSTSSDQPFQSILKEQLDSFSNARKKAYEEIKRKEDNNE